ncbi:MAG: glutamate--tRNA ligase, partial [Cyclobacteriaceae bacterium]
NPVRVRFAPSPTGPLHIGGLRTALYNFLYARKHNGVMILRIEDTDQNRYVEGTEDYIHQSLQWAGIEIDEGPLAGGPHQPYRQSERSHIYRQYADQLVAEGKAYYAFDTPEELEEMRTRLKEARVANPQYNAITRTNMSNSLTMSEEEVQKRIDRGDPYVIRLKVPKKEEVRFHDLIRDWVVVLSTTIDDKILLKSDGMPTYHLANVVDDHLMKITHVIRGEEWLPSAPLHVLLYRFLGWEETMPKFAHLPLILKPDGNGKLSKRDSVKHGFPIFPMQWNDPESGEDLLGFREEGYQTEAFINFLALLGWNPGTEEEIFSLEELINKFSLERINKAGAKFDIEKANWFNQEYLKKTTSEILGQKLIQILKQQGIVDYPEEKAAKICEAMKGRITFLEDIWKDSRFFFKKPDEYDDKIASKRWTAESEEILSAYVQNLKQVEEWQKDNLKAQLEKVLEEKDAKMGKVMQPLRLTLTGSGAGPDLMDVLEILGKNEVIERIEKAIISLHNRVNA